MQSLCGKGTQQLCLLPEMPLLPFLLAMKVSQHCCFRAGRGDWAIMSFFPVPSETFSYLLYYKTNLPKASLPEQCQITGVLLIIPQLRGFSLEFCFKHSANLTNHLFWRESVLFDSAMIAQSFMVFVLKVDSRFSNTKVCFYEYYSKTSWVL